MYKIKVPCLNKYLERVKSLLGSFNYFKLERIPWLKNDYVDTLAKLASMKMSSKNQSIIWSIMLSPSIEKNDSMCIDEKKSWMDPIEMYLKNQTLSKNKRQAKKIKK